MCVVIGKKADIGKVARTSGIKSMKRKIQDLETKNAFLESEKAELVKQNMAMVREHVLYV